MAYLKNPRSKDIVQEIDCKMEGSEVYLKK